MSGKNNVNPGQYKVAGREKPGKPLGLERDRRRAIAGSRQKARGGEEQRRKRDAAHGKLSSK